MCHNQINFKTEIGQNEQTGRSIKQALSLYVLFAAVPIVSCIIALSE